MTGEPLNGELQQPDVVGALFVAVKALERVERIERRTGSLPDHAGRAWAADEERQLCDEFAAGKTLAEISKIHQRTGGAIQRRLERLGKIPPTREAI